MNDQEETTVRPATTGERLFAALRHAVRMNWRLVLLSLVVTSAFMLVLASRTAWDLGGWWGAVQNIGTCLTLVVAFLVWVGELHQEWIEGHPKRLTVRFRYKDRVVMACEGAYLAGASDIRAWAQQLGGQMSDDYNLKLFPNLEQRQPELVREMVAGRPHLFLHYTVNVTLRTLPETLKEVEHRWEAAAVHPLVHWKDPTFFDERHKDSGGAPKKVGTALPT